jgi:hypothetical protein
MTWESQGNCSFNALSYVWGENATLCHAISFRPCHNQICKSGLCQAHSSYSFKITRSCYSALRRLQQLFGPLTIWVDSICINQRDQGEKFSQIPLIQEIYTKAETVYIWLSEGNERTDRAMKHLRKRGTIMSRLPPALLAAWS